MHARINYFEGDAQKLDEAVDYAKAEILPRARELEGFSGLMLFADRQSGQYIAITLWDSAESMKASEHEASKTRAASARALEQQFVRVERTELLFLDFEKPAKAQVEAATNG